MSNELKNDKYVVVRQSDLSLLITLVNAYWDKGYRPLGTIVIEHIHSKHPPRDYEDYECKYIQVLTKAYKGTTDEPDS